MRKYLILVLLLTSCIGGYLYYKFVVKSNQDSIVQPTVAHEVTSAIEPTFKGNNIIFNTIPKSGSVYIATTLKDSLGYTNTALSASYFPRDVINFSKADSFFKNKSMISQDHFDSSKVNIQWLTKYTDRMVIHLRDPRQVLLSWVHNMNWIKKNGWDDLLYMVTPTPPSEYYKWKLSKQIDWNIENFLPEVVAWMNAWLEFKEQEDAKDNGFKILLTTYDDFLSDDIGFYNKVLDFYEIPREQFVYKPAEKTETTHFRKGDVNEWRKVLTQAQKDRVNEIVPLALLQKFGWE